MKNKSGQKKTGMAPVTGEAKKALVRAMKAGQDYVDKAVKERKAREARNGLNNKPILHGDATYHSTEPRMELNEAGWLVQRPLHLNEAGWLVS